MLPKKHRLPLHQKSLVAKRERKNLTQGKYFGLLITKQETNSESRYAIIASTKVSKKATQRNKVRRRLNEAIRELLKETKKGYDIVILTKKSALTASYQEILEDIKYTFAKAGILNKAATI
jgi:ribonuclease P protein component